MRYKKDDKVVPHSKSIYGQSLDDSVVYLNAKAKGQDFLYVDRYTTYDGQECLVLVEDENTTGGDYFFESDISMYVDPTVKVVPELVEDVQIKIADKVKITIEYGEGNYIQINSEGIMIKGDSITLNETKGE